MEHTSWHSAPIQLALLWSANIYNPLYTKASVEFCKLCNTLIKIHSYVALLQHCGLVEEDSTISAPFTRPLHNKIFLGVWSQEKDIEVILTP